MDLFILLIKKKTGKEAMIYFYDVNAYVLCSLR